MISRAHGAAARFSDMPVIAVASRSVERAEERAREMGSRPVTYDDILDRRVEADIAIVSTPPQCHARDAIALLDAGYAVVLEKPCAGRLPKPTRSSRHRPPCRTTVVRREPGLLAGVQRLVELVPDLGAATHLEVRALQSLPDWASSPRTSGVAVRCSIWRPSVGGGAAGGQRVGRRSAGLGAGHVAGRHRTRQRRARRGVRHPRQRAGVAGRVELAAQRGGGVGRADRQPHGCAAAELLPSPQLEHNGEIVELPATTISVAQVEQYGYLAQLRAFADDVQRGTTPVMSASFGRLVLDVVCAAYRSAGRSGSPKRCRSRAPATGRRCSCGEVPERSPATTNDQTAVTFRPRRPCAPGRFEFDLLTLFQRSVPRTLDVGEVDEDSGPSSREMNRSPSER